MAVAGYCVYQLSWPSSVTTASPLLTDPMYPLICVVKTVRSRSEGSRQTQRDFSGGVCSELGLHPSRQGRHSRRKVWSILTMARRTPRGPHRCARMEVGSQYLLLVSLFVKYSSSGRCGTPDDSHKPPSESQIPLPHFPQETFKANC